MKKIIIGFGILLLIIYLGKKYNESVDADYPPEKPEVELKASLLFDGAQFTIKNKDTFDYENAKLTLNDDYKLDVGTIGAGKTYTVGILQFSNSDDDRFTFAKKPKEMMLSCTVAGEITIARWELNQ